MSLTNWYASGTESSTVPSPVSTTSSAEITSLELFDNSEVDIVDIAYASGKQKFLQTILALGRLHNGGDLKSQGLTEMVSNNFPLINWIEQDEEAKVFTLNGTLTNVATSVTLVTTAGIIPGQILRINETNENVRVTSVDSGTQLTVVRWQGSIGGTAVTVGTGKVTALSIAASAGFSNPDAIGAAGGNKFNYVQKFVDGVDINDFNQLSAKAGGDKKKFIMDHMARARAEHMMKMELAMIYGQRSTGVVGGQPYYQTQGVLDVCRNGWTSDISSTLTRSKLDEALSTPMNYGSTSKILLCGTRVRPAISELFYKDQVRTENLTGDGINLTVEKLTVNGGEYYIIQHPYLDANRGMEKYAGIIDVENFKLVYPSGVDINGRAYTGKTRFEYLPNESSYARQRGDWVTYLGTKITNPNAFWMLKIVA